MTAEQMQGERQPRACIVVPGSLGTTPRAVKEADALAAAGLEVTVIATRTLQRLEFWDDALLARVTWNAVRVDLRAPSTWRFNRARQMAARTAFGLTGNSRLADVALNAATLPLMRVAMQTPADLYIAHYPSALPAVVQAARRHGARYAYDAEDFHLGDWPDEPTYETERRIVRAIEGRHLADAAYVTAASPGIADALAEAYGIERPRVVLNVFPLSQRDEPAEGAAAVRRPSIYWFSQTIGPNRGLECAVEAIAAARSRPHLYLRGEPAAGYAQQIHALAASLGVVDRLHLLAPAGPDEMVRLASAYDLGLCGEEALTAARRVCLTNKLFTFIAAGVPPLISDTPAQWSFARESGLGDLIYPARDATALAALIDRLLDPARLLAARTHAARLAQERYNWERESGRVVELARGALTGDGGKSTKNLAMHALQQGRA